MASAESHGQEENSRSLMRELRTKQNARFLQKMPAFQLHAELPDRMQSLLDQLEREERKGSGANQAGALGAACPQR